MLDTFPEQRENDPTMRNTIATGGCGMPSTTLSPGR